MQDVTWPVDDGVESPSVAVTTNNFQREVESYSVRASVGGSDVAARTGAVVWAPGRDVYQQQDTVLTTGTPRRGDRVLIDAGDGDAKARVFTGKVDITSSAVPGPLESELMDDWDMLSAEVDIPSLTATMYPDIDEGPLREIGLTATWPTQMALRQAGFWATPDGWPGGSVTASLNGSLWPEVGEIMGSAARPTWVTAPWGDGARGYGVTFRPYIRGFSDGDLQISFLVGNTDSTAASFLYASWGDHYIQARVEADRTVSGRLIAGGTTTSVLSIAGAQMAGAEYVVLRVSRGGVWRLVADNGASRTATRSLPSAITGIPSEWGINVSATAQVVGGVNFGFAETAGIPTFKRTAQLSTASGTLAASRAIISRPAQDVLRERAEAEGARMWIDANGVFQWRSSGTWGAGSPVRTISDVDLLGYRLGMDYDSVFSGAVVNHLGPIVDVRAYSTITLYQGSRQVLNAGDRETTIITVPDDEDWPAVDWSMDVLNQSGSMPSFSRGKRSWTGGVRIDSEGVSRYATGFDGDWATFTFETINPVTWVHTVVVSSALSTADTIETRSPNVEDTDTIWPAWREQNLPVFRGYARVVWLDRKTYGATSTTVILPRMQHDAGWWVQGGAVQRLADHLSAKFSAPVVTIKGLEIVPDQRIEIGDVLTLNDATYAGLSARVVVTGINLDGSNGSASMSLDVEVLSVTTTRKTYADVQAQAGARTYAQFQALIGAVTYTEQEAP